MSRGRDRRAQFPNSQSVSIAEELMVIRLTCGVVLVAMAVVPSAAAGQAAPADLTATPALADAAQKIRTELALTSEQQSKAQAILVDRLTRAEAVVDSFGDISLDSVIDLLSEARSMQKEFIPQLNALLTPEQRTKLANMSKSRDLWGDLTSAWMAEARLKKLASRVTLTGEQVPQVRDALLSQFRDATAIIHGLFRPTTGQQPSKQAMFDAVLDLRAAIRAGQRKIDRLLTPEQRVALEAYKTDSEKASQAKSGP